MLVLLSPQRLPGPTTEFILALTSLWSASYLSDELYFLHQQFPGSFGKTDEPGHRIRPTNGRAQPWVLHTPINRYVHLWLRVTTLCGPFIPDKLHPPLMSCIPPFLIMTQTNSLNWAIPVALQQSPTSPLKFSLSSSQISGEGKSSVSVQCLKKNDQFRCSAHPHTVTNYRWVKSLNTKVSSRGK